ncbi:MAG: Crp/Fnr family transcriptional regulator [Bacteroidetes bacterium]|nr:MAG: Crp/Fnr family transcriptional regulator [Bacteroidota bacterium]
MFKNFFHIFDFVNFFRKRKMKKMYKAQIRGFISSIVPFSDKDWALFDKRLVYKEFEKNEILLRAGEVENYMYFLVEGVTRIFQFQNDIEYTLRFNFPITPFNSYASFITQSPSLINVEAITDVKVLRMSYSDMQSLYEESKMAERVGRRMIELLYVQREIKELQMHSKTAEDYYCEMLDANDSLVQHIPQKHLASYLGITPESLSRIKKKIACS